MKKRVFIFIDELEKRAIIAIQNGENDKAFKYAHMSQGIKEAIKVAEHLSSEIVQGKFDVDESLHVIEKNAAETVEEERKEPWIRKILGIHKNRLQSKKKR